VVWPDPQNTVKEVGPVDGAVKTTITWSFEGIAVASPKIADLYAAFADMDAVETGALSTSSFIAPVEFTTQMETVMVPAVAPDAQRLRTQLPA
jgi:hypothetical protein